MPIDAPTDDARAVTRTADRGTSVERTIVFTDIESSTELTALLGDDAWFEILCRHDDTVERCVDDFGGTLVKSLGDGFLIAFDHPAVAAACCLELRRRLDDDPALERIRVRAGIHHGSVISHRGDVIGTTVNTAARVAGAAIGGQILVSSTVAAAIDPALTVYALTAELKGLGGHHELSSLVPA